MSVCKYIYIYVFRRHYYLATCVAQKLYRFCKTWLTVFSFLSDLVGSKSQVSQSSAMLWEDTHPPHPAVLIIDLSWQRRNKLLLNVTCVCVCVCVCVFQEKQTAGFAALTEEQGSCGLIVGYKVQVGCISFYLCVLLSGWQVSPTNTKQQELCGQVLYYI